ASGDAELRERGLGKVLPEADAKEQNFAATSTAVAAETTSSAKDGSPRVGSILGTLAYMPPEQARSELDSIGKASDVFGLGAILCEILTGLPPFTGSCAAARSLAERSLQPAFERLNRCGQDEELVSLAKRFLAPEPADRLADAGQVAAAVRAYLDGVQERLGQAEVQGAEARARAAEERKRRRLAVALAGAVLGLVLMGGGGWFYLTQQRAERERDALTRQAGAERQIQEALSRADGLRRQARADNDPAKWTEARALADRAKSLLGDLPEGHELTGRVQ